jgi:exodeoxyribonuclease V alpha subunit
MTGGAGVGKTTVLQHLLVKLWGDKDSGVTPKNTFIGCPTGKASRVVNDAMPSDFLFNKAMTLHRLLRFNPSLGWEYNENNPIDARLIICDESSMVSSVLLARVIAAMPEDCHLVLVGDSQQLLPVEPGSPFHDILNYGDQSTVFRLDKNYRQQQGSLIADGCEKILTGTMPMWGEKDKHTLGGPLQDDLFFIKKEDKEDIPRHVLDVCKDWWNNGDDFVVLSPQKSGVVGVEEINKYLQMTLNPPDNGKAEIKVGWLTLREGDRCLQTRNNYELGNGGVFNGFMGVVKAILTMDGEDGHRVLVDFDGEMVEYTEAKHIKDLALGYAISYHKSQGSQWDKGVIICHSSHHFMLNRNLLYVGVSRFKEELHVIGDIRAVKRGLSNVVSGERNTLLKLRLRGEG